MAIPSKVECSFLINYIPKNVFKKLAYAYCNKFF